MGMNLKLKNTFLAGDFNFDEKEYRTTEKFSKQWREFKTKNNLTEVPSNIPTFMRMETKKGRQNIILKSLDKILIPFDFAEYEIYRPQIKMSSDDK